jgi:hypothetical protein
MIAEIRMLEVKEKVSFNYDECITFFFSFRMKLPCIAHSGQTDGFNFMTSRKKARE